MTSIDSVEPLAGSPSQGEVFDLLSAEEGFAAAEGPRRDAASGPAPLSFAQERLWMIDQIHPGLPVYNSPSALRIDGDFDVAVFEQALTELVRRHEVLRSPIVVTADGLPTQQPEAVRAAAVAVDDLRALAAHARDQRLQAILSAEADRVFDLATGPFVRSRVIRVADRQSIVIVTTHHIVSDRWSNQILLGELATLYDAFRRGVPSPLPALPLQYADYARWQRERLTGSRLDALLDYWRAAVGDPGDVLALPLDHSRPSRRTFRAARERVTCPPEVRDGLRRLAGEHGVTLFMALLAAFQTLLHRYSGQARIRVGTPISGRDHVDLEQLIGVFVNTLPLMTSFKGDPPFAELLARVRAGVLGAFAHKDLPFERLVDAVGAPRDLSTPPLVQAMFVYQERQGEQPAGGVLQPVPIDSSTSPFDLMLVAADEDDGLRCTIEYSLDLFTPGTIQRMAEAWRILLESIVTQPDTRVSALTMLSEAQRRQQLSEWNPPDDETPAGRCVHEIFDQVATASPDRIAITCGTERISYGELRARVDRWAVRLRRGGVGPETIVGLCIPRSIDMMAALLAVMKAGGTYLPLDESQPAERLSFMLTQAKAALVLTGADAPEALNAAGLPVMCLASDESWPDDALAPAVAAVSPLNTAYVIYTSGSTGRPKGVAVTHGSLTNILSWLVGELELNPDDRFLAITTLGFDIAVVELLLPLIAGASLDIVPREMGRDGDVLAERHRREAFTVVQGTPSTWRMLLDGGWTDVAPLKVICCGEALPLDLARTVASGHRTLWNLYGPTEATVFATGYRLRAPIDAITIGGPVGRTRAHVLGPALELLPVGATGELYLGGVALARGYVNDPRTTAARFVPDPFEYGARLYRTGDLARRTNDGAIEYLGRADHQVKIRGHRIELGEIEAVLGDHPDVRHCSVVATHDPGTGDTAIVAYVVTGADADAQRLIANGGLRAFLARTLPEFMLPAFIVAVEALPRLPSGKIDRAALRALRPQSPAATARCRMLTPIEQIIAGIWSEVLGHEVADPNQNFFHTGGHSLLAAQVMSRVRRIFPVDLTMGVMFEAPTLAAMACAVQAAMGNGAAEGSIGRARRDGPLPLSYSQQRLWYLHQLNPSTAAYHMPISARLGGAVDLDALQRALDEIVRRHEILRTAFVAVDGVPAQVIANQQTLPLTVCDLRTEPPAERLDRLRESMRKEIERPFDLRVTPLVRAAVFRVADDDHRLVITMHHIVSDGWSVGRLIAEASTLYDAFRAGRESPLSDLPIQYADYVAWEREQLSRSRLEEEIEHWRGTLADADVLTLPLDRPRPLEPGYRGRTATFACSAPVTDALRQLGRQEGATLFMTLLAVFQTLLFRYSGQPTFRIGSVVAGRDRWELEPLIGLFVNTIVLRANCAGNPSFRELLRRVRATALDAYAHQRVPFAHLVSALHPARDAGRTPLFEVMFGLDDAVHGPRPPAAGAAVAGDGVEVHTTKFDLSLFLHDTPEGLRGAMQYDVDLFDASTVERLITHFQTLLRELVAAPDAPIGQVDMLATAERAELGRRAPARMASGTPCAHELFEQRAAETPAALAVSCGERRIAYGELNVLANRWAHELRRRGAGPGTLVALCLDRSIDLVAALLAVMKSGAAYVPMDPSHPAERRAVILAQSGAAIILSRRGLADGLARDGSTTLIDVDANWAEVSPATEQNPTPAAGPSHAAHVLYTSGSTGVPKGVVIEHGSLTNVLRWMQTTFEIDATDRVLAAATLTFDIAAAEIHLPLMCGASLEMASREAVRDGAEIIRLMAADAFTLVQGTPSTWQLLLDAGWSEARPLKLLSAGEALPPALAARLVDGPRRVWNLYGPTETTVYATACEVRRDGPIHLGVPVANTCVYVLGPALELVPTGGVGVLYIGGAGLARGYLASPRMTAASFVPDPFESSGGRLYRTGDLGRRRPDGGFEYVGRVDHQVKIRGHRIELGEIEATLRQHPQVQWAAVVAAAHPAGGHALVAYVVAADRNSQPHLADRLRSHLQARLPDVMVPSVFMTLDAVPMNANGKLDRKALPAPVWGGAPGAAPRTDAERTLADIWAAVLGMSEVSVDDNFFELGGDSILSIQIVARAAKAGLRITSRQIFQHPTVVELARVAEVIAPAASAPAASASHDEWTRLHPAQAWFFERSLSDAHWWNQSVWMEMREPLDAAALARAFAVVQEHHEALRMRFTQDAEGWRQRPASPDVSAVIEIDLRAVPQAQRSRAITAACEQVQQSLDFATGPLARAALIRVDAAGGDRLLIVAHHLVVDIVSWPIVLDDLQRAYAQVRRGEPLVLGSRSTSYRTWSERLVAHAASREMAAELSYWERALMGAPSPMPVDDARGARHQGASADMTLRLSEADTESLMREASRSYQLQPHEVVLAALARTLTAWAGAASVLVDIEGHGREELWKDVDLSRTVGWFTAIYPVRLTCRGALGDVLKRVKETMRAVPHGGIGYGLLRYLTPAAIQRRMGDLPPATVSFNFTGRTQSGMPTALLRAAQEGTGASHSPLGARAYELDINAGIQQGGLWLTLTYSQQRYRRDTVTQLAARVEDALREIAAHCRLHSGYTPSDFPLAGLSQTALDELLNSVAVDAEGE